MSKLTTLHIYFSKYQPDFIENGQWSPEVSLHKSGTTETYIRHHVKSIDVDLGVDLDALPDELANAEIEELKSHLQKVRADNQLKEKAIEDKINSLLAIEHK